MSSLTLEESNDNILCHCSLCQCQHLVTQMRSLHIDIHPCLQTKGHSLRHDNNDYNFERRRPLVMFVRMMSHILCCCVDCNPLGLFRFREREDSPSNNESRMTSRQIVFHLFFRTGVGTTTEYVVT